MGLNFLGSSSSYDTDLQPVGRIPNLPTGNPDPRNYEILAEERRGDYLIVIVHYPDCHNYEGLKLMVYKWSNHLHEAWAQYGMDPHFSRTRAWRAPVARFKPTSEGLAMARKVCEP